MKKKLAVSPHFNSIGGSNLLVCFSRGGPNFSLDEANFTVKDTNAIQTIFLSNLKNETSKYPVKMIHGS